MIFLWYIEFSEEFRFTDSTEDFIDEGERIMILDRDLIEISIIDV